MKTPGGLGSPSSLAVPDRVAEFGRITVWSGPAFTVGGWFCDAGFTVTVRSSLLCRAESSAVSRSTYVPDAEKLAVVARDLASPKVTVPGGFGRPSAVTVPLTLALEGSVIV